MFTLELGPGLEMAFGFFFVSFFTYLSCHVDRSARRILVQRYKDYFLSCTEYVAKLVRRSKTEIASCSRALVSVVKESGAA